MRLGVLKGFDLDTFFTVTDWSQKGQKNLPAETSESSRFQVQFKVICLSFVSSQDLETILEDYPQEKVSGP